MINYIKRRKNRTTELLIKEVNIIANLGNERDLQKSIIYQYNALESIYGNKLNYAIFSFGEVKQISSRFQAINKAMGYVQGSPDIIVAMADKMLFIDLKTPKNNITKSSTKTQKPVAELLRKRLNIEMHFINNSDCFWNLLKKEGANHVGK